MAKAKFVPADQSVEDMVSRVITAWPDRFIHLNRKDICLIFKDAPKNAFKAKTNITNGVYRALTNKKIIIQIHKQEWALMKETDRALLIYRELYRVDLNAKDKSEYKLIHEDVKDFKKILEKTGLNNETAEMFLSKVTEVK
jgi:hypothetical protein